MQLVLGLFMYLEGEGELPFPSAFPKRAAALTALSMFQQAIQTMFRKK